MVNADVIVAGAGPTGLLLANELHLAGVRVTVLERLAQPSGQARALNLQPRTAEILALRGWLTPISDRALARLPAGHFAGLPLDYTGFDTDFPYQLGIPQSRVAEFLAARLIQHGVPVLSGTELTGFTQDPAGVTVHTNTGVLRAGYLVGADGGRSTVRKLLGVGFPGRDGRMSMVVADVLLTGAGSAGEWRLPTLEPAEGGVSFLLDLGDGTHRILFGGPAQQGLDRDTPVTEDEVRAALHARYGSAVDLRAIRWASRFTDASRQADRYRVGRVLLAGDAAHIHLPAGGQGLNLGMQDAFNLGWKLAACVRGWAPAGLLDTYHAERHPVGARVLANTRAQGVLTVPDPDVVALRGIVAELLDEPAANRRLAGLISGLDIRYDLPGTPDHPLLGTALRRIELLDGRARLVEFTDRPVLGELVAGWSDRVGHTLAAPRADATAALVRPDGHVCWAGADPNGLAAALGRWFGAPLSQPASVGR